MSQPPAKAQKTPKSALMELYQTYRAPPPKFDVISGPPPPAPPNFLCRLSLPGITFNGKTMKEQECRAEGPNKKAAVHAACLEALRIVDQAGLLPSNINISNGPAAAADQFLSDLGQDRQATGVVPPQTEPAESRGVDAVVVELLGGRNLHEVPPLELREPLAKVLEINSRLRAELHHEEMRRKSALPILLGLT